MTTAILKYVLIWCRYGCCAAAASIWLLGVAGAQQRTEAPILRIETGVHAAVVLGIAASPDGKLIATASHDRTVRIWTLPSLGPVTTFHLPIGPSIQGAVYSVAFSPDGKFLATSGWTGGWDSDTNWCFYVLSIETDDIARTVCGLPRRVNHVAYSPDGQFLAVVMKEGAGVRVYRTSDFSLAMQDTNYGDTSTWVEFDKAGRMVTSSFDGKVRLYDRDLHLIAARAISGSRKIDGLSISPDGTKIAVAFFEAEIGDPILPPEVDVISATDPSLPLLFKPDLRGMDNGALWRVAWSSDGKYLYAGGSWQQGRRFPIRRWADGGRGRPTNITAAPGVIERLIALPEGGIAFTGESPFIGVLGPNDRVTVEPRLSVADYTEIGDSLAVSRDGRTVQFALEANGRKPCYFSLDRQTLDCGQEPKNVDWARPITEAPDLDVRDWARSYQPALNGKPLSLRLHEQSVALAFTHDQASFVLGTLWRIIRYNAKGDLAWAAEIPFAVRGLVITHDDRLLVAALGDGTLRWYSMDTGKELLALFPHPDGHRWVAWTVHGYYTASVAGDSMIGWQVNRGREHTGDFYPVGQFEDQYLRPDIVTRVLALRDEDAAIRAAALESGRSPVAAKPADILPPVTKILYPKDSTGIQDTSLSVRYRIHGAAGARIKRIFARIENHILGPFDAPDLDATGEATGDLALIVPQHDSSLILFAENEFGTSTPTEIKLRWTGPRADRTVKRKVFVLSIGISDYAAVTGLEFADKDAEDFIGTLQRQVGSNFSAVVPKLMKNSDATLQNIRAGLAWIDQNTGPDDVGIIFLAGHGFDDTDGTYYYIPHDGDLDHLKGTALPYSELLAALKNIHGYPVLFIDTCHAGDVLGHADQASMDVNGLVNRLSHAPKGIIVYASSTGEQESIESKLWQHGAFTKAVIEGLDGGARYRNRATITSTMLELYLKETIPELTGGRQQATASMPIGIPDLPLARVPQ